MILESLFHLYERFNADPDIEIAQDGFSYQPVSFEIVLELDGSLHAVNPLLTENKPKKMILLGDTKPSGAGMNPCFLWDNPVYLLGVKSDDPKPDRTLACFQTFCEFHNKVCNDIDSPEFRAVCLFLNKWDPSADSIEKLPEEIRQMILNLPIGNGVFKIRNSLSYVHQIPKIKMWWSARTDKKKWWESAESEKPILGQCAITGINEVPIARLHEPKIKGVMGTNMAGASIVSFNESAYNSYGFDQSRNASISEDAAFAYCNALNKLLSPELGQKIQVGETTIVFWTEKPTFFENCFAQFFSVSKEEDNSEADKDEDNQVSDQPAQSLLFEQESRPSQSLSKVSTLKATLTKLSRGVYAKELGDPEIRFFLLGLSPNAGRISVRNWSVSNLGSLAKNIGQHFQDLSIHHGPNEPDFPPVRDILKQTVRDAKDIPDIHVGPLFRSIIEGLPYPESLFAAVIRRIRADRITNSIRVGLLKATLNRKSRLSNFSNMKEITVSLDPDRPESAYQLGRLFAALEKNQQDALGDRLNATIKDRYFGAASATPGSVFPRLIRLSQHHLANLEGGRRVNAEKRMQEVMSKLAQFPAHLSLAEQGLFAIGYYHQKQDFFTRKEPVTTTE